MCVQSSGSFRTRILVSLLLILPLSGCGLHEAEHLESAETGESSSGITPEMIQEYAMIHQISNLETAEFYLTHPEYAKEHPYRPTSEDLEFFERKFLESVYPTFSKIAEKRGFSHTRGTYMSFNPHDSTVGRSWKSKYVMNEELKKTALLNNEFETAKKLYKEERFPEAVEHMEIALRADPESPTLLYNMGIMYMKVENYAGAVQNFNMSIRQLRGTGYTNVNMAIHPKVYMGATTNLGLVYINLGMYEEAVKTLKEAIEFQPEDPDANWNLGVAYWYMGDIEQTTVQMRRYLTLDPKSPEAHNIIGLIYYQKELYDIALDEFQQAAKLNPGEKQYSYNEGLTYARLERYDEAMGAFKRASGLAGAEEMHRIFAEQLAANKVRKLYNDGCAAMDGFDSKRAVELFEAALELKPDMVEAHVNLGNLYGMLGNSKSQIRHLEEAVKLEPDMANVRYSLGLAYFDARMYSEAMTEFQQAITLDPSLSGAHFKLGMVLCKAQSYSEAAVEFEKCLELSPGWYEVHINLGTCYLKIGNVNEAINQFEKSIELKPTSAEAHYYLGEAYIRVEKFDKTSALFQKALQLDPGYEQARARLREVQLYQNQ